MNTVYKLCSNNILVFFQVCNVNQSIRKSHWDSNLINYDCECDDDGILTNYMFVIVVISVSLRDSTLLRLETDTVTSLELDLDNNLGVIKEVLLQPTNLKNLTNPCLFSTSSILLFVVFSFLFILKAKTSCEGWNVLRKMLAHNLGELKTIRERAA